MKSQRITHKLITALREWVTRNTLHDIGSDLNQVANATRAYEHASPMPTIVTLCGSTYFKAEFEAVQRLETQNGRIVLTVGMFTHADGWAVTDGMKAELDALHKRKIDISDEIIVLNVGGYVGESTRSEIEHAIANAVMVRWLHVDKVPAPWGEYVCPHKTAYLAKFSKDDAFNNLDLCKGTSCSRVAGSDMPHSSECIAEHAAIVNYGGFTGQPDLPPIVPEMLASPNAQPETPEPDMEAVDAMERAGRLAMVEETRQAWLGRDLGHKVATSGWIQTVSTAGDLTEMRHESGRAFENRYHKSAAAVPRADWDCAYLQLAQSRATCTAKEIEDLALTFGTRPQVDGE